MGALASATLFAVKKAFQVAYGEDFDVALQTGIARAEALDWSPDAGNEVTDFIALTVGSMLVGKDASDTQPSAQKLLARTYVVLGKQDGYVDGQPANSGKAAGLQSNVLLVALAAIIIVAEAAVVIYCVYRATQLVTNFLAQNSADREMMRAHKDAMQTIDAHAKKESIAGHALPYDAGELAVLEALQQAQDNALKINLGTVASGGKPPIDPSLSDGIMIGVIGAIAAGAYLLSRR